jgi:methionyl aminopeptidase
MKNETVVILSTRELDKMRKAGRLAAELLDHLEPMVKPGVSTLELNDEAERWTQAHGAKSAPLGYHGFPKSICTSVNEVVCHGIPNAKQILKEGDIINIDVTQECLNRGIAEVKPGARIGDIGAAIQEYAESNGFSVVRDFVGHGVSNIFHTAPEIPHYGTRGKGKLLRAGMVFTIEPMINLGTWEVEVLSDKWTAVTRDRKLTAQFEHTLAVTENGVEILTMLDAE